MTSNLQSHSWVVCGPTPILIYGPISTLQSQQSTPLPQHNKQLVVELPMSSPLLKHNETKDNIAQENTHTQKYMNNFWSGMVTSTFAPPLRCIFSLGSYIIEKIS